MWIGACHLVSRYFSLSILEAFKCKGTFLEGYAVFKKCVLFLNVVQRTPRVGLPTRKSGGARKLFGWFLVHMIYTFVQIRKFRKKQPQRILMNLCLALLGLYVAFIVGIDRRHPTTVCIVFGFLIHYFLLASMAWMLVEAVNMYLMFIKVLNVAISRFMLKASLCAWGELRRWILCIHRKQLTSFCVWFWSYDWT